MKIMIETSSAKVEKEIRKIAKRRGAKSFRVKESELEDLALSIIAKKGLKGKTVSKATVLRTLKAK
jgi:hypothetical protein